MATTTRTINLRAKLVKIHTTRRLAKAMDYLREDIARHAKTNPKNVKFTPLLNDFMLSIVSNDMSVVKVNIEPSGTNIKADLTDNLKKVIQKKTGVTKKMEVKTTPSPSGKGTEKGKPAKQEHTATSSKQVKPKTDSGKAAVQPKKV